LFSRKKGPRKVVVDEDFLFTREKKLDLDEWFLTRIPR